MRTVRIYENSVLQQNQTLLLSEAASHHLSAVLRVKPGQALILFNGDGYEYAAEVIAVRKRVEVHILSAKIQNRESPLFLHLLQAVSKNERMDFTIQKSVELGISAISVFFSRRGEVKLSGDRLLKKIAHWQSIIINACEQSGRTKMPSLQWTDTFSQTIAQVKEPQRYLLHPADKGETAPLLAVLPTAILIGPEGGFDEEEVESARASGFFPLSLGPRILRTETASLAAISYFQTRVGDFK